MRSHNNIAYAQHKRQSLRTVDYIHDSCAPALYKSAPLILLEGGKSEAFRSQRNSRVTLRQQRRSASFEYARQLSMAILLFMLVLSMFLAVHFQNSINHERLDAALASVELESVIVLPGDTLWGIAQDHSIDNLTIQETMRFITDYNHLDNVNTLMAGQQLVVPLAHK